LFALPSDKLASMKTKYIYHMCRFDEWQMALSVGVYPGSSQDIADGFMHFSNAEQIKDSAAKHRAGQNNLVLLTVDTDVLGNGLKWEPSRGGALFPHLYGPLLVDQVMRTDALNLNEAGAHVFPDDLK